MDPLCCKAERIFNLGKIALNLGYEQRRIQVFL